MIKLLTLMLLFVGGGAHEPPHDNSADNRARKPLNPVCIPAGAVGGGATTTVFSAGLSSNGHTEAAPGTTWNVPGVTAADFIWWGGDPTGSGTATSGTWDADHGAPAAGQETPFCPDGSFSDVTSGCLGAVVFDGDTPDGYISNETNLFNCDSADCSFCVLTWETEINGASGNPIVDALDRSGTVSNVMIYTDSTDRFVSGMWNDAGGSATNLNNNLTPMSLGGWAMFCGEHDYDGSMDNWANMRANLGGASAGGTSDNAGYPVTVGARGSGGAESGFSGAIAGVWFWNSLLDATDMSEFYTYFVGVTDSETNAPAAFANTGPVAVWIDGKLSMFHDDWPMVGAGMPPGATGAGSPTSGYLSNQELTNVVLGTAMYPGGWTGVGAGMRPVSAVNFWRDGRDTRALKDDDAGSHEYIHQTIAKGGATSVALIVYTASEAGTDTMTLEIDELTGGGCGAPATNTTTHTTTTAINSKLVAYTFVDAGCTDIKISLYPVNKALGVGETGSIATVVQVFFDIDYQPPFVIVTEASAVAAGDSDLSWDITGSDIIDGTGKLTSTAELSFDHVPSLADVSVAGILWEITDTATANDYITLRRNADEKAELVGKSTEDGAEVQLWVSNAALGWTPGTTYSWKVVLNVEGTVSVTRDLATVAAGSTASLTAGPNALDTMYAGGSGGASQTNDWFKGVVVKK